VLSIVIGKPICNPIPPTDPAPLDPPAPPLPIIKPPLLFNLIVSPDDPPVIVNAGVPVPLD
jgi:hypothetical protein